MRLIRRRGGGAIVWILVYGIALHMTVISGKAN